MAKINNLNKTKQKLDSEINLESSADSMEKAASFGDVLKTADSKDKSILSSLVTGKEVK
jgi:hypothetical protein